jgi:hypothetical protein
MHVRNLQQMIGRGSTWTCIAAIAANTRWSWRLQTQIDDLRTPRREEHEPRAHHSRTSARAGNEASGGYEGSWLKLRVESASTRNGRRSSNRSPVAAGSPSESSATSKRFSDSNQSRESEVPSEVDVSTQMTTARTPTSTDAAPTPSACCDRFRTDRRRRRLLQSLRQES